MGLIGYGVESLLDQFVGLLTSLEQEIANGEVIHLGIDETAIGIIRSADNGFSPDVE